MPQTRASGVRIRYYVAGAGEPVVLIHGFSASVETNWRMSGIIEALASQYRVMAMDLRGHGESAKPWRTRSYSTAQLARDVLAVMDAEGIGAARIVGYSMGGMVGLRLLLNRPERIRAAVIGGMGAALPRRWDDRDTCIDCEQPGDADRHARRFSGRFLRAYASHINPIAMYAAYQGVLRAHRPISTARLASIQRPVLCVAGSRDHLCRSAQALAENVPGAQFLLLRGESHLSALGNPLLRDAMLRFFASV